MKKLLFSLILLASTVAAAFAMPPGSYCDKRGQLKYIVHQNGKEVYYIADDGKVIMTLIVVREELADDGETTKVTLQTQGSYVQSRMEYWTENGETYLHNGLQKYRRE